MKEKPYTARITRQNPSAFVFMLDLSGSMADKVHFNGERVTKAAAVTGLINDILSELVNRCRREEGYRDYLDIAVIGYGGDGVWSLLPEGNSHPLFRKPDELAYAPVDTARRFRERVLPDGNKVISCVENKEWVKPSALGKTPMYAALEKVYRVLYDWTRDPCASGSYPPVVIHISDGEATDAEDHELLALSEKLRSLRTADGHVLLMNIYIGPDSDRPGLLFPASDAELPDSPYARLLFGMSSPLPEIYRERISGMTGKPTPETCRAMSYNTSMSELVSLLRIGSVSISLIS